METEKATRTYNLLEQKHWQVFTACDLILLYHFCGTIELPKCAMAPPTIIHRRYDSFDHYALRA